MGRLAGLAVACLGVLTGCERAFVEWADERGAKIQAEKVLVVDSFRRNLADPTKNVDKGPAPQSDYEFQVDVPEVLQLADAIRIATKYNRGYISRRENFFLTMLGLDLTRHNFLDVNFAGSISYNGSILDGAKLTHGTQLALSGSKLLPTGGSISVSGNMSQDYFRTPNATLGFQSAAAGLSVNFSQPLLRGAGRTIAWEGLNSAERSAVYAARDFEEFRQTFAIDVIQRYYNLVAEKKGLAIVEQTMESQEYSWREAKALYRVNRTTKQDELRAEQNYRDAQNRYLNAKQDYARRLDEFKIFLGLPLTLNLEIGEETPPFFEVVIDRNAAINAALHNRLSIATQRDRLDDTIRGLKIARNGLLPDLDVSVGATVGSLEGNTLNLGDFDWGPWAASFGFSLEIPLDRVAERNNLRSAMISVAQARRSLRETEDRVILDVRDALRGLDTQRKTLANEQQNLVTIRRRITKARIDHRAGIASNRDEVEAKQELASAALSLLRLQVSYYIEVLRLRQSLGLLFVDKEGRIVE